MSIAAMKTDTTTPASAVAPAKAVKSLQTRVSARLGLMLRATAIGLDTGCVWGGELTAVRLQDRRTVQIACPQRLEPNGN
jgi:hypothetical protein